MKKFMLGVEKSFLIIAVLMAFVVSTAVFAEETGTTNMVDNPSNNIVNSVANKEILKSGTVIPLSIMQLLNSKLNSPGETVYLSVDNDILVDGKVVIQKGALAIGKVNEVKQSRSMGTAGEINFTITSVRAVDGQQVFLDKDVFGAQGAQRTGATVGYVFLFGVFGFFTKGGEGNVLLKTSYDATIRENTEIFLDKISQPAIETVYDHKLTGQTDKKYSIRLLRGRLDEIFEVNIPIGPEFTSNIPSSLESVQIVKIGDFDLPKPIMPSKIENVKGKSLKIQFTGWSVLQFSPPSKTNLMLQIKLSDGKIALVQYDYEVEWVK